MASALRVTAIAPATDPAFAGFTRLDLEDGSWSNQSPAWVAKNRPEVGGFFMDGATEQWYARPPSVPAGADRLVECVRIEVAKLELRPGDVLAVRFPDGKPPADQVHYMQCHLRHKLPDIEVLFYGPGIELAVVKPPAPAASFLSETPLV